MERDLFDYEEELPQEVLDILAEFEDGEETYDECAHLVVRLEQVGYTCDYGLDASPYGLRKL